MPKRTSTKPESRSTGDDLDAILADFAAGHRSAITPVVRHLGPIQAKLATADPLSEADVIQLGRLVKAIPVLRETVRGKGRDREKVSYIVFVDALCQAVLQAGERLAVDVEPVVRTIHLWQKDDAGEDVSGLWGPSDMVLVKTRWERLRAAAREFLLHGDNGKWSEPMTKRDIAAEVGVTTDKSVNRMIADGRIEVKPHGKLWRYRSTGTR